MGTIQKEPDKVNLERIWARVPIVPLVLVGFSLFYFADVWLRAREKYFWYDELFTLYLCRLDLHSLWGALREGIDANPPFFYILTKGSQALFGGEGLIATRIPEMIGFWILCLCLFWSVKRRAGLHAGVVAMLFPMFTGAFYYAYEARPHGIVLGFAGLSLVCWQMAVEGKPRRLWLVLFGSSLFCAFMTHCYALALVFPYAAAELPLMIKERRLNYGIWVAMVVPAVVASLIYIPLLRSFHQVTQGTQFISNRPPEWFQISRYYHFLLGPCLLIILVAFVLLWLDRVIGPLRGLTLPTRDLFLVLGFLALPVIGVVLGKLVHAPFFDRYVLSALIGVCFLLGSIFAPSRSGPRNWSGLAVLIVFSCTLALGFCELVIHRLHHSGEVLVEPSSQVNLDTTPWNPLANESVVLSDGQQSVPIATGDPLTFLYLLQYAPDLAGRLHFITGSANDSFYRIFEKSKNLIPRHNPPETYRQFIQVNPKFDLYGGSEVCQEASDLISKGWQLGWLRSWGGHNLARLRSASDVSTTSVHSWSRTVSAAASTGSDDWLQ